MGMNTEAERRKSFSFAYFSRPISRTESVWHKDAARLSDSGARQSPQSSVVSGEYAEILSPEESTQVDCVFTAPPFIDRFGDELMDEPDDEPVDDDSTFNFRPVAPPETEWFHGYLDRSEAEKLLNKQPCGSYIVRISIPKSNTPTKYILTVRTEIGFQHYKIKTYLGDYFISLYKFPTLGSIIGYFSQVSPLLSDLYLKSPLSPKQAVSREKKLKAKASYSPSNEEDSCSNALSFKKGDTFITDDILEGDWIQGRKESTGEIGLIMRALVQEIPVQPEDYFKYEWYHGSISDITVQDILKYEEEGRYVITTTGTNNYCMHIKSGAEVKQTPIYSTSDGKFMMGAQSHDSIPHCIDTKSRVFGGTLRPVTRKNERSTVYGPGTFIRDDKISAKWRPSTSKEAKPIKIYFDGEDALISSDKKGDKGEKMISLKDCKVYEVDRSLSKVPHCLQVVVGGLNKEIQKYYIEVDSADKYNELLSKLQNSTPMDEGPTPPGKRTKNLRIKVCSLDGNLTLPTPVHCQLGFDNSTVQRTPDVNNSKRLCWNSVLYCKHNNVEKSEELKITLCYYKNKKLCELSAGTFNLKTLTNMTFQTYYSPYLSIKNQNGQGRLKLEFYYRDHVVLQPECYHELIRELKRNNFRTLKVLRSSRWCWNHETREAFACVLLTVFSNSKISLIMELTKDEIERHPQNDKGYLFRDNTITTALIVALFQSPPTNIYLDNVFNKITCEINTRVKLRADSPTEEEKEEDKNAVLDILIESVSEIPQTVLDVIRHILREVATKWPSDPNIQTAILLGVMFVRFYKIRLTNPTDTDISHFHPETQQALLSVAKSIKRKDMDGFLNAILANPSHHSAIYEAPQDNTIDSVEAGDGAHLYHLIQHTIHTTSSNTNSIQHEADKPHLQSLLVALDKINKAEKECN